MRRVDEFREYPYSASSAGAAVMSLNLANLHNVVVVGGGPTRWKRTSQVLRCCLRQSVHAADSSSCRLRAQEVLIIATVCQRRCSRLEALSYVQTAASWLC